MTHQCAQKRVAGLGSVLGFLVHHLLLRWSLKGLRVLTDFL